MIKGDVVKIRDYYIYRGEKYAKNYIGGAFLVNRDLYEIISVNGEIAVIGVGEIPFAAVLLSILEPVETDKAWKEPCISIGDKVHIQTDRDYMGHCLPAEIEESEYSVLSVAQDRVVVGNKKKSFAICGDYVEVL